jgi:hypothetical protein
MVVGFIAGGEASLIRQVEDKVKVNEGRGDSFYKASGARLLRRSQVPTERLAGLISRGWSIMKRLFHFDCRKRAVLAAVSPWISFRSFRWLLE